MITVTEYVPANKIWPNAKAHVDRGYQPGLVRGYNVEVITHDGKLDWFSCEYIHSEPWEELFDDFHMRWYAGCNCKPTGRISFRGYGREDYDPDERETFIIPVEDEDV